MKPRNLYFDFQSIVLVSRKITFPDWEKLSLFVVAEKIGTSLFIRSFIG
jgi:hypothetical protein